MKIKTIKDKQLKVGPIEDKKQMKVKTVEVRNNWM